MAWVEHIAAIFGVARLLAAVTRRTRSAEPSEHPDEISEDARDDAREHQEGKYDGDHGLYTVIPAWRRWERDQRSIWQRIKDKLAGRQRTPIPSYIGLIEQPPADGEGVKTGVCCSGGGIRSAAFNLGALQQIQAREQSWKGVKYLAAVSGGSYIAAAFSMVAKTPPVDPHTGKVDPENDDSDPTLFKPGRDPFYHGSPEEQYLRNRSSYLAPGGVGRLRLLLRVALGLLVNFAFVAATLLLAALVLALFYRLAHGGLVGPSDQAKAGTTGLENGLAIGFAGLGLVAGIASLLVRSIHDRAQRVCETLALWFFGVAAAIVVITLAIPELIEFLRNRYGGGGSEPVSTGEAQGGAGVAAGSSFLALLLAAVLELRSKLSSETAKEAKAWYQKLAAPLRRAIAQVAIWLAGPLLLFALLVLAVVWMVGSPLSPLPLIAAGAVFGWFWRFSDVTSWSLHPFYRRRLCTAFALKRVRRPGAHGDFGTAEERNYAKLVSLSKSGVTVGSGPHKAWPTLVVCAAANVSDPGATPPGRSVTSFTFSPVAMGGPLVGGVHTRAFEEYIAPKKKHDFNLAAAVAMSGAAVSPSMGKETRRSVRFLLALANVRLGVWVPNPRATESWLEKSGKGVRERMDRVIAHDRGKVQQPLPGAIEVPEQRYRKWVFAPRAGPWYLIKEMLGWNSVNDAYLYVTDGGHYENLGLVELLRRGCTEIFCFDASGGERMDALGDAIALARSELRVEIEIDVRALKENEDRIAGDCCARGKIKYPDGGPEGVLIYARTVVTEDAPYDVQAFRIKDEHFPHHSTLDQLYTDQKFEAYRELGAHAARAAIKESVQARAEVAPVAGSTNGGPVRQPLTA